MMKLNFYLFEHINQLKLDLRSLTNFDFLYLLLLLNLYHDDFLTKCLIV